MNEQRFISIEEICIKLKRYSFESKMAICNRYSQMLMSPIGNIKIENIEKGALPWELECFVLLAIKATPEYSFADFSDKREKAFCDMINGIRNSEIVPLKQYKGTTEYLRYYVTSAALLQFDIQEDLRIKLFRYTYFFDYISDDINMREEFFKKFGAYYERFMILGAVICNIYSFKNYRFSREVINRLLIDIFPDVYKELTISYLDYKEELNSITNDINMYISCLRPSYKYPFIQREDKVYIPLPHLMGRSVTTSLLYRLTDNDDALRSKFGKEVLENYIYRIVLDSKVYDEVVHEHIFKREHNNIGRTSDVMARYNNHTIFIESKAAVPAMGMRVYDVEKYKNTCEQLAKTVKQLYTNIVEDYRKYPEYNPFKGCEISDNENCWGCVVLLEDSYVRREDVFIRVASMLNIAKESKEYIWLINHIKIMHLYTVERYSLTGINLIEVIKHEAEVSEPFNFEPTYDNGDSIQNEQYLEFEEKLKERMRDVFLRMESLQD